VTHVIANVAIEDLANFIAMFSTRGAQLRAQHGSSSSQVFGVEGDEHRVVILFEWSSKADFEGFLADPTTREAMKASGTVGMPQFTILEKIAEYAS
jgi:heme-degrading monooxygenase HmoA